MLLVTRQLELLAFLVGACVNKTIGAKLELAIGTVKSNNSVLEAARKPLRQLMSRIFFCPI